MSTSSRDSTPRLETVSCISPAGLHKMAYTEWGDPANPRVLLCVHGLTRSGRDFDTLARYLSSAYRVVCPDLVGRGHSDWLVNPAFYTLPQYLCDLITLIARLRVTTLDWLGTSLGGLIGLMLAGLPNTPINKLLLNDVGPRLNMPSLERIATYLGQPVQFSSQQQGLDYLAEISAPFGQHSAAQWRTLNLPQLREVAGQWRLHYDPQITLPFQAAIAARDPNSEALLWQAFDAITCPVLVMRGALSDLLSEASATEMQQRGRDVSVVEIANVGHAPMLMHAEQIHIVQNFFLGTHAAEPLPSIATR